ALAQRDGEALELGEDGSLTLARREGARTAIVTLGPPGAGPPLRWGLLALALLAGAALTWAARERLWARAGAVLGCAALCAAGAPDRTTRVLALAAALPGLLLCWAHARGHLARLREHGFAYAYLAPAAAGMIVLVLVPFAFGCVLGFFDHARGSYSYVGL